MPGKGSKYREFYYLSGRITCMVVGVNKPIISIVVNRETLKNDLYRQIFLLFAQIFYYLEGKCLSMILSTLFSPKYRRNFIKMHIIGGGGGGGGKGVGVWIGSKTL